MTTMDNFAMMKEVTEVKRVAVYQGHTASVYSLVSAGPAEFYSGGGDHIVALWNLNGPAEGKMLINVPHIIYDLLPVMNGQQLLVGQSAGGIHVIDIHAKKELRLLQFHEAPVFHLAQASLHSLCFSLSGDGTLAVFNSESWSLIRQIKISEGKLRSAAISSRQDIIAIGAMDGMISLFELPTMKLIKNWQAHQAGFSVNALAFSPDGKYLLSGSRDAHLNIFEVSADFSLFQSIPAHNYAIYSIAFSHDNHQFATGSRDKTIKIWDAHTFEVLNRIDHERSDGHVNSVNKVIWHPSGLVISASDDRSIMTWEVGVR